MTPLVPVAPAAEQMPETLHQRCRGVNSSLNQLGVMIMMVSMRQGEIRGCVVPESNCDSTVRSNSALGIQVSTSTTVDSVSGDGGT